MRIDGRRHRARKMARAVRLAFAEFLRAPICIIAGFLLDPGPARRWRSSCTSIGAYVVSGQRLAEVTAYTLAGASIVAGVLEDAIVRTKKRDITSDPPLGIDERMLSGLGDHFRQETAATVRRKGPTGALRRQTR